jgi:hypothetical protein
MNKPCAIVIVYNGTADITPQAAHNIIQTMFDCGVTATPKLTELKAFDTDALADIIIEDLIVRTHKSEVKIVDLTNKQQSKPDPEVEAIENAYVFLGTMFAESLKKGKETINYSEFAMSLMLGINDERISNAIEILATKTGKVSGRKWNQYNMTTAALDVIKDIYRSDPRFK